MSPEWDDEPLITGHDVHFLGRVAERVPMEHADLALRLYRDSLLVKSILDDEAPADAARVAVALALGPSPPHAIIERSGRFVTCLGAGMATDDTPTVSRERVEIHLHRANLRAESEERIKSVFKSERGAVRLLRGVEACGARLSREHFQQLAAIAPVLEDHFVAQLLDTLKYTISIVRLVQRVTRIRPHHEPGLLQFWNAFHAIGHYLLLSTIRGRASFHRWQCVDPSIDLDAYRAVYFEPMRFGRGFVALRALHAFGRAGDLAVPTVKRLLNDAPDGVRWAHAAYALVALGRRHSKLRGELSRAIGPTRVPEFLPTEAPTKEWLADIRTALLARWVVASAPPGAEALRKQHLAEALVRNHLGLAHDEQAGDALSMARLAHLDYDFNGEKHTHFPLAVALCASVSAEELYFPAADIHLAPRFTPAGAVALSGFLALPPEPVRAPAKPGRNELCPCGSGKKYKRCCGSGQG